MVLGTVAIIVAFLFLADFLISTNSNSGLKKPKVRCQDMTGDVYNFVIPMVVGRHLRAGKDAVDSSVVEAFTHPIRYTRFNLATAPVGSSLEPTLDLTKRYPEVIEHS